MNQSIKTDRKQVNILGIGVDSTSRNRLLRAVENKISHNSKFYIVTPNSELILASTENKKLKVALNSADFSVPDSVGLKLANLNLRIIKGRALFIDLVKLAHKRGWKLFFFGGLDNEAEITAKKLGAAFAAGPRLDSEGEPMNKSEARIEVSSISKINEYKPDLLFVAFGNPKQEIWIHKNLPKLNVRGAMAVGGTFRYVAGISSLPPRLMESLGLEWLWRVLTEPFRLKRIFNAVILFPLKLLRSKLG